MTTSEFATRYCPVCRTTTDGPFAPGPGGRPDASCPKCRSLERQRFLAILLDGLSPVLHHSDVFIDVAPSPQTSPLFRALQPRRYVRIDFDPTADGRPIDVRASLTSLPFPDRSVAVMVCYHVLEHVPDDAAAMSDIARVLRLDGLAIVQVPWRPMLPTDEDPGAGRDERIRRFGQADHVRYYGVDFEDRLRRAGLAVSRVTPRALVGPAACRWMNLRPDEAVWIVRPARLIGDGASGVDSAGALAGLLEQLLARNNVLERRLVKARFEAKRWKQRYELVHDHWVLRWYRRVARPAARLLGRSRH